MRVSVDQARCQGHALCVLGAPALFDLDDVESRAYPLADPVPAGVGDLARAAAASCPERAIKISDDREYR